MSLLGLTNFTAIDIGRPTFIEAFLISIAGAQAVLEIKEALI